jgi:diguanylate cyclase (GGDEF)-like protein
MKTMKMSNREFPNLVLTVLISISFSIFSVSIHLFHKMFEYFYPYTRLPVLELLFSVIFFWLACLIWTTYRSWKKAEVKQEKLRDLSLRDELTKLYNRRGFFTLAEQQVKIAKRLNNEISLLYMDINGLKWINDSFGHRKGDQALIDAANILKGTFRESDIIARIGGDEFVTFLFGASQEAAEVPVKRLQENIAEFNAQRNRKYKLQLSTGIVSYDYKHPLSIDELLEQADRLMYKEKREKSERLPEVQCVMEEA